MRPKRTRQLCANPWWKKQTAKECVYGFDIYNIFEMYFNKQKTLEQLIPNLKKALPKLKYLEKKNAEHDTDTRSGMETYGYKSKDSILASLEYISDRWHCRFRLRWLIDLLELHTDKDNNIKI